MEPIQVTYNPRVFDVGSSDDAMRIILTPEGATTEHRWATETPYLADLIAGTFALTEQSLDAPEHVVKCERIVLHQARDGRNVPIHRRHDGAPSLAH